MSISFIRICLSLYILVRLPPDIRKFIFAYVFLSILYNVYSTHRCNNVHVSVTVSILILVFAVFVATFSGCQLLYLSPTLAQNGAIILGARDRNDVRLSHHLEKRAIRKVGQIESLVGTLTCTPTRHDHIRVS